jgi:hypothetical protein
LPSVPVTACGVVNVDAVSGVNRVFGSIPPGGTSGAAEPDAAGEAADAVVAEGALGEHPLATRSAAAKTASGAMRRRLAKRHEGVRAGSGRRWLGCTSS